MKWFGESWGAPICEDATHVATPVGERCARCREAVGATDRGVLVPMLGKGRDAAYHMECFLRGIIGSVAHQQHCCSCYGGEDEDDPALTLRQAAVAAANYYRSQGAGRTIPGEENVHV